VLEGAGSIIEMIYGMCLTHYASFKGCPSFPSKHHRDDVWHMEVSSGFSVRVQLLIHKGEMMCRRHYASF